MRVAAVRVPINQRLPLLSRAAVKGDVERLRPLGHQCWRRSAIGLLLCHEGKAIRTAVARSVATLSPTVGMPNGRDPHRRAFYVHPPNRRWLVALLRQKPFTQARKLSIEVLLERSDRGAIHASGSGYDDALPGVKTSRRGQGRTVAPGGVERSPRGGVGHREAVHHET